MKNQKGFTIIEGLVIAFIIGIIGFGGYYVWSKNQNGEAEDKSNQQQMESQNNEQQDSAAEYNQNSEEYIDLASLVDQEIKTELKRIFGIGLTRYVSSLENPDEEYSPYLVSIYRYQNVSNDTLRVYIQGEITEEEAVNLAKVIFRIAGPQVTELQTINIRDEFDAAINVDSANVRRIDVPILN